MYFDMINKKTGSLLGASAALPIVYNDGSEEQLYIYMNNLDGISEWVFKYTMIY